MPWDICWFGHFMSSKCMLSVILLLCCDINEEMLLKNVQQRWWRWQSLNKCWKFSFIFGKTLTFHVFSSFMLHISSFFLHRNRNLYIEAGGRVVIVIVNKNILYLYLLLHFWARFGYCDTKELLKMQWCSNFDLRYTSMP
jgi:hypothetical protein